MQVTPRMIVLGARVALVGCALGDALSLLAMIGPVLAALVLGYVGSLAGLLAFPRVRRGDVLTAVAAGMALRVCLPAFASGRLDIAALAAGFVGIGLATAPIAAGYIRRRAASNARMAFSEWRLIEQRRRRGDLPAEQVALAPATQMLPQPTR